MINKFFKTIHNKYLRLFKFIFFLRYLFAIFLISISFFLIIPTFFNYEKREQIIKNFLLEDYNLEIGEYKNIEYKAFPVPNLELKKVQAKFVKSNTILNVNNLKIYPKIFSIYNFNYFEAKKIVFNQSAADIKIINLLIFIDQLFNQKNKLSFNDLNLKILNENKLVLHFKNTSFANFGYKKNFIEGKVFEKKFKAELGNNLEFIKFRMLNSGISAELDLDKKKRNGKFKSKILNNNLKFNFEYDNKKLKIFNSFFRSKNLTFSNESLITFDPFFDINTKLILQEFNLRIFDKINIIQFKKNIKKINSKNTITYKPKNFSRSFIDELNLQVDLVYGRINYKKNFLLAKNLFKCEGDINILDEYPLLYFDCSVLINDKKRLFKKFSINTKSNKDILRLKAKGNLNILNNKINFNQISLNEKNSNKEDLKYFKNSFENIFFDKSVLEIFDLKKIKNYILEII